MSQIKCLIMAFNKTIAEELADRLSTLSKYNDFTPSSYQQQLISFVMKGTGNGIVQAVAGSGKTTTIMQAMNELRKQHGTLTIKKSNSTQYRTQNTRNTKVCS